MSRRVCLALAGVCLIAADVLSLVAAEPARVRVLSYNIHHGEGTDGQVDLERIAAIIRAEKPDLVALQEVDRETSRTGRVDQPAELGRLTGMQARFERNIAFGGGEYGNAVLTRLPVVRHKNHHLPSHYDGEQRGALAVEVALADGGQKILFLATHLDYRPDDGERRASAEVIHRLASEGANLPAIVAGDLNALPESDVLADFQRSWKRTNTEIIATYPAAMPTRQIDYILVRPAERWRVVETRVLDAPGESDHRPIMAVLELVAE